MRKLSYLFFILFIVVSACKAPPPTAVVDPYRGTPPAGIATDDPLHEPVLKPTSEQTETVIQLPPPDSEVQSRSAITGNGIRCDLDNNGTCNNADRVLLNTDIQATANAPRPTVTTVSTATPRATSTTRPAATATNAPTPTVAPQATATTMPMPTPGTACKNCVTVIEQAPNPAPDIHGQPCPTWAHDQWIVLAPNGRMYRTWHPAVQLEGLPGAGCIFDHQHGPKDPRLSNADPSLPAYGYAADQHGMSEPHVGFKTEYQNAGECNVFEGFCATSDVRATFHQGTLGAGRVAQRFHSFEFDLRNVSNGAEVHVEGMGDTGFASNQCVPPDQLNTENGTIGIRFFAMPKPVADACGVGTPYEVWEFVFPLDGDNRIHAKLGTFDAITVLNPASGLLEPTSVTWPNAPFSGCKADAYFGPIILNSDVDAVDSYGIRQIIRVGSVKNFPLDTVGKSAFKNSFDDCTHEPYTNN